MVVKAKDETIATLRAENEMLAAQIETEDEPIAAAHRLLAAPKPAPKPAQPGRYAELLEKLEALIAFSEKIGSLSNPMRAENALLFALDRFG